MVIYIDREEVRRREAGQATKVDGEVVENEVEAKDRSVRMEGLRAEITGCKTCAGSLCRYYFLGLSGHKLQQQQTNPK